MIHLARGALAGLAVSVVLAAAPATAQTRSTVTLPDGRRIAMTCAGEGGGPTVVFDTGLGMPMESWNKVLPEVGKTTRACAYNRAGYAGSDAGPMPRDAAHMVDDIRAMLTAAKLPGPYVLVSQSLGGHNVRLFAARYPDEVAGVVMIDPITDREELIYAAIRLKPEDEVAVSRCVATRARGETWSATDPAFATCGPPPTLPASAADIAMAQAVLSEWDNRNAGPQQIRDAGKAPARYPLIVLTADGATRSAGNGDRAAVQAVFVDLHRQIAATSTAGEQRITAGGDHLMNWNQPQAVIPVVREVVERYRASAP